MVELSFIWLIGGGIALIISGIVGGFLARIFLDSFGYSKLEAEMISLRNKINGNLGVEVKAEKQKLKDERLAMAIAEYVALKESGADNAQILKELAPKYIDIAPEVLKMMGVKGGFKGLLSM